MHCIFYILVILEALFALSFYLLLTLSFHFRFLPLNSFKYNKIYTFCNILHCLIIPYKQIKFQGKYFQYNNIIINKHNSYQIDARKQFCVLNHNIFLIIKFIISATI